MLSLNSRPRSSPRLTVCHFIVGNRGTRRHRCRRTVAVQTLFGRDALEILSDERRDVSWIATVEKVDEMATQDERRERAKALLVRCGQQEPSVRFQETTKLAKHRPRVLEMLDDL